MSEDMNESHKEQCSAFIDNEIGPKALSDLAVNDDLLHRYQLIGEAMKGDLCDAALVDVSAEVSLAIESEPVPSKARVKASQNTSSKQPWFNLSAWLRPVGGMAVAASVAIVMVMVINQPETNESGIGAPAAQIAIDNTGPVMSLPVSNVNHNISDKINTKVVESKDDESEKDLKNLKNKVQNALPQNGMSQ